MEVKKGAVSCDTWIPAPALKHTRGCVSSLASLSRGVTSDELIN